MRILALDTATLTASVAVLAGDDIAAAADGRADTHSERLLPLIDEVLRQAGLAPASLDAIACGAGPGSFTGLRIGLATAKGLCFALHKPLVLVSSLEALAFAARGRDVLALLDAKKREVYAAMRSMEKASYSRVNGFQDKIAHGQENDWRCRAGSRYLYICEDGLVHYCSQQRGYPGKPLLQYTVEDIRREYRTEKGCAPRCTVACVHQVGYIDFWRDPQDLKQTPVNDGSLVQIQ